MSFAICARRPTKQPSFTTFMMISLPIPLFGGLLGVVFFRVIFQVFIIVVHCINLVLEILIIFIFIPFVAVIFLLSLGIEAVDRVLLLFLLLRVFLTWRRTRWDCRRSYFLRLRKYFYFFFSRFMVKRKSHLGLSSSFWASREKSTYSKGNKSSILFIFRVVASVCSLWIAWGCDDCFLCLI